MREILLVLQVLRVVEQQVIVVKHHFEGLRCHVDNVKYGRSGLWNNRFAIFLVMRRVLLTEFYDILVWVKYRLVIATWKGQAIFIGITLLIIWILKQHSLSFSHCIRVTNLIQYLYLREIYIGAGTPYRTSRVITPASILSTHLPVIIALHAIVI